MKEDEMTLDQTGQYGRIERAVDVDALMDELPPEEYSRTEVLRVLEAMVERRVPISAASVLHALEAEEIKFELRRLGIVTHDDGRNDQVSPTSNGKGRVMLTFNQVTKLIKLAMED